MTQAVIYTQEELEARCKVWQERLRLQDWIVHVVLVNRREIGNDGWCGYCQSRPFLKEAKIVVLNEDDYNLLHNQDGDRPCDMECTLVHEPLHLLIPGEEGQDNLTYEQGIECLATSFVRAWRRVETLEAAEKRRPKKQEAA